MQNQKIKQLSLRNYFSEDDNKKSSYELYIINKILDDSLLRYQLELPGHTVTLPETYDETLLEKSTLTMT